MRHWRSFWCLLMLLAWPFAAGAQVFPGGGGGGGTFTNASCANQVVTGLTSAGGLICSTLTAAYVDNSIAKTGVDINSGHQVTATHLSSPLSFPQGGHGLGSGAPGGVLYFPTTTSLGSSLPLPQNEPVIGGGGGQPPSTGTRSGPGTKFATVEGGLMANRQVAFDVDGNLSATDFPPGLPTQVGLTWDVNTTACTNDVNGGKFTATLDNRIVCVPDQGGSAGGGGSITAVGNITSGPAFTDAFPGQRLLFTPIAPPATPSSGALLYMSASANILHVKNDAGLVTHGVQTQVPTGNLVVVGINDAGQVITGVPSLATLASALAANAGNCVAGQFPLGVDATGAAEGCTALPTSLAGTTNQISVSAATGPIVLSLATNPTLPGTTTGTFVGSLSGNASTATALAANGTNCSAGQFPLGVDANGAAESCTALPTALSGTPNQIAVSGSTGSITLSIPTNPTLPGTTTGTFFGSLSGNALTASALASDPTACGSNLFVTDIAANGTLTCTQPTFANLSGTATAAQLPTPTTSAGGKVQAKDCTGVGHILSINADSTVTCSADAGASGGLGDPGSSGIVIRTSAGSTVTRTLTGTANQIAITNGDGVSGNPVFSIPTSPTLPGTTTGTFTGPLTGNATTATALAANGSNCSAGQFPLGVDASGVAESCTALPTTIVGTANQISASAATGTVTLSTPQDIGTASAVQHGRLGLGVAPPASAGMLALTAGANNVTMVLLKRNTDASPTGNFQAFQDAAGGALWTVDITGSLNAGTIPGTRVSGSIAGNAGTATALAADPTDCTSNQFATGIAANGNLTCTQPAFTNLSGSATSAQLPNPATSAGGKVQAKDCTGTGHILAINSDSTVTCSADAGASGGIGDPGSNGIIVRTALASTIARTLTGTANQIAITNGDGVSGNPTVAIASSPTLPGTTTGTFVGNLTGNVAGTASTATALATNGTNCSAGQFPLGVDASGVVESCTALPTTIVGTANQIVASAATGTVTLSTPQDIGLASAVQHGRLGLGESAPATAGMAAATAAANNVTMHRLKRNTDVAPTGAFTDYQTAAGASLWTVDITGSLTVGTIPGARVTGGIAGNAGTATALAANGGNCSAGQFPLGVDASGAVESCTPLPTTLAGTTNQISVSASTGAIVLSIPTSPTLPGTTTGTFSGNLTGNVTGTASAATALAANGANCSAGQFPLGVDASGVAEGCTALPTTLAGTTNQISVSAATGAVIVSIPTNPVLPGTTSGTFSGSLTGNASTASALTTDPTACGTNLFVTDIAANGALTCTQPAFTNLTGTASSAQLPNPTTSAGGRVQAKDCTGVGHVLSINADSTVTCSADTGGGGGGLVAFAAGAAGNATYYTGATTGDDSTGLTLSATNVLTLFPQVTTVTNANLTLGAHHTIACSAGSADRTIALPSAASTTVGVYKIIKIDTGAGACRVARAGSDTINGTSATADATTQWSVVQVQLVNAGSPGNWLASFGTAAPFQPLAQTGTYQVLPSDFAAYRTITVSGGTFTLTLVPSTAQPLTGQFINVINYGTGVVTIARSGQTINGAATSITLPAGSPTAPTSSLIVSDSTNYFASLGGAGGGGAVTGGVTKGYVHLPVASAKLPTSNPATIDTSENNPRLLFDASIQECAWWPFLMPPDYGSSPQIRLMYSMTSATSGGVVMDVAIMAIASGATADINTDSYDTGNTCTDATVPAVAGRPKAIVCALATTDAMAASTHIKVKVCRAVANGTDTATGDFELVGALLEYTKN